MMGKVCTLCKIYSYDVVSEPGFGSARLAPSFDLETRRITRINKIINIFNESKKI